MDDSTLQHGEFPKEYSIEDIKVEIETTKINGDKTKRCRHSAIIKNGPRAFQIAVCWEIVNEHTGELHHYSISIYGLKKFKNKNWEIDAIYNIEDLEKFNALLQFFKAIDNDELGIETKKQYLISAEQQRILEKVESSDDSFIQEIIDNKGTYNQLMNVGGVDLLKDLLELTIKQENSISLLNKFKDFDPKTLRELHTLAGISQLKSVRELWMNNIDNSDEEFWQKTLSKNSWVISQIFSCPIVMIEEKCYVGGTEMDGTGSKFVDFVFQNKTSTNIILIEIKTPNTRLIGTEYRSHYGLTKELTGSIVQVLDYKTSLNREYQKLVKGRKAPTESINPCCLLIIGNFKKEIGDDQKKKETFELFRSNSNHADIITFDELFSKLDILIRLLEGEVIDGA